jgi:hypothetical protein
VISHDLGAMEVDRRSHGGHVSQGRIVEIGTDLHPSASLHKLLLAARLSPDPRAGARSLG